MFDWSSNVGEGPLGLPEDAFDPRVIAYPFEPGTGGPFIEVTAEGVKFTGQRGPIKEVGVNGCQIDDVMLFVLKTLQHFQRKFPCRENALAITKLEESLMWLEARRSNRESRGVEGKDLK